MFNSTPVSHIGSVLAGRLFTNNILYLQEQYELRESLNGLNHQAIQSDPVNTRCLLLLETKREKKNNAVGKMFLHRKTMKGKLCHSYFKRSLSEFSMGHVWACEWVNKVWKSGSVSHVIGWKRRFFWVCYMSNVLLWAQVRSRCPFSRSVKSV